MAEKSVKNVGKRKALNVIITRRFIPVEDGAERWEYAINTFLRVTLRYMREHNIPLTMRPDLIPGEPQADRTPGEPIPIPSLKGGGQEAVEL